MPAGPAVVGVVRDVDALAGSQVALRATEHVGRGAAAGTPLEQTSLVPHGFPQLPQFAGSLVGSTQTPLQSMVGDGQTHAPFTRWSAKADGTPPSNAPLSCSV